MIEHVTDKSAQTAEHKPRHKQVRTCDSVLRYIHTTAEELSKEESFDLVVASEVIEHVSDPESFMKTLSALTKPNGHVVVSTLSRTLKSYCLAIVAAEHVLGLLPKGTHDWHKFITPQELAMMASEAGLHMTQLTGLTFAPKTQQWKLTKDTNVNYISLFQKL